MLSIKAIRFMLVMIISISFGCMFLPTNIRNAHKSVALARDISVIHIDTVPSSSPEASYAYYLRPKWSCSLKPYLNSRKTYEWLNSYQQTDLPMADVLHPWIVRGQSISRPIR